MRHTAFTIVCNQADWIERNVRHHAPHFDRIVVVEGPALEVPIGRGNGLRLTGGKPHSTDGTREVIRKMAGEIKNLGYVFVERPWKGKTEMCDAALSHAEPGCLWQIDADEFWHPDTIAEVKFLMQETDYTDLEFFAYHFWPTPEYHVAIRSDCWGNRIPWRRVFKWDGKCKWASHEPPRLNRPEKLLDYNETRALGLMFFHYGYTNRKLFRDREVFYNLPKGSLTKPREDWLRAKDVSKPGSCPPSVAGPLVRFADKHPIDVSWIHD